MKKGLIIFFIILAIVILAITTAFAIGMLNQPVKEPSKSSTSASTHPAAPAVNITFDNLAAELSKNSMIKALPDNAALLLKIGERSFIIQKGSVKEGTGDADITLTLPEKYLTGLTNTNLCNVIQRANTNKDLGFETSLSKMALAWKFRSMMSYKSCFGL